MRLELESGKVLEGPTEEELRDAIDGEEFGILGADENTYIQFAERKDPPYDYVLEYQDGALERHFTAVDRPISLERVTSALVSYLGGSAAWKTSFQWQRIALESGQAPDSPAPPQCPDCDADPGQLHEWFCLKERCPFCGGQLASCGCIGAVLELTPAELRVVEEYEDDSIDPLRGIVERWKRAIQKRGRIPWGH